MAVLPDYRLAVSFRDGRNGIVDCSAITPTSNPDVDRPLRDDDFFARVRVQLGALAWPNGADLDPGRLHAELDDGKSCSLSF